MRPSSEPAATRRRRRACSASPGDASARGCTAWKRKSPTSPKAFLESRHWGQGKLDGEGGPHPDCALDADVAPHALENVAADGEPEPGAEALGLGGEEGLEEARQYLRRDSRAGVAHTRYCAAARDLGDDVHAVLLH